MSKVLLIDIGGTNLRYAYSDGDLSSFNNTNKIKLSCIKGFNDILKNLTEGEDVDSLVISVAGPKINGSITMTNRDFSINEKDIQDSFNFKTCHLLNDWESIGHSLAAFDEKPYHYGSRYYRVASGLSHSSQAAHAYLRQLLRYSLFGK